LKGSNATSARAATAAPRPTVRSSDKRPPTLTSVDDFALTGPSDPPDASYNAFRKDLADVALTHRVIASHYAEPIERTIIADTLLRDAPSEGAEVVRELLPGDPFLLLDDSVGWAWGYAGEDKRVGYVRSEAVGG
jgi:hypothetical protein